MNIEKIADRWMVDAGLRIVINNIETLQEYIQMKIPKGNLKNTDESNVKNIIEHLEVYYNEIQTSIDLTKNYLEQSISDLEELIDE